VCWGLTGLCSHTSEQIRIEDLASRTLRVATGKISEVQQPDWEFRQETEQADQTFSALHLPLFETTPGFETLVIVFYDPAKLIPADALGNLAQASSWLPRSPASIPRALPRQESALPTP
jgi:hypothetical protein